MVKDTFSPVLKANGFKKQKKHHKDITGYCKGEDPSTCLYAEVYKQNNWWYYVWIVGKGISDNGFPGGMCIWDAEKLQKVLSTLK